VSAVELTRIGRAEDVPLWEGRSVMVGGRRIAVFRTADGWRALGGVCPHEGGPLADGIVADSCVTCPLHGWRFDLDSGEAVNADARVTSYEVVERRGELWLRLPRSGLAEAA
jgi:nitrite reductase (NADH) small subunit